MTQKDKELLLKDLCARLPYGVKIQLTWWVMDDGTYMNTTLEPNHIEQLLNNEIGNTDDTEIKPYLRPMSSMTDEEKLEYRKTQWVYQADYCAPEYFDDLESYDWLNKNHFDYRGLIEKGLAIDATVLNIY